jgi:hypothetical protein
MLLEVLPRGQHKGTIEFLSLPIEERKENYIESRVDSTHETDRVKKKKKKYYTCCASFMLL